MKMTMAVRRRNLLILILTAALIFSLPGCGSSSSSTDATSGDNEENSVSESTTDDSDNDSDNYAGEGQTQGGIPTDEELAEREAEADSYLGDDSDDRNVEMETVPTASDTFIPASNFISGDFFDIEEYYWMNGASEVRWPHREDPEEMIITPIARFYGWDIIVGANSCTVYNAEEYYSGILTATYSILGNGDSKEEIYITHEDDIIIFTSVPEMLDVIIPCLRDNHTEKDPFMESTLDYICLD